ncbi:MAG TPA: cupin domain-containing protein [Sphingomicrobium sp.]|nr:cupin domain-containing protein [Sphingomicrobium sp.]
MMIRTAGLAAALMLTACGQRGAAPADNAAVTEAPAAADKAAAAGPAEPSASDRPVAIAAAAADLKWGGCPPGMPEGCQIAVLHGDPAKPDADIFLKVPGGAAIPPHWHTASERIMLVSGQLEVQYKGSAPATLTPGSYAYGPARLPHRGDCRSATPCILFIAFDLPVDRHDYAGTI